jgi:predicted pyridoxine 5'-phosphate oxidase superfamily flavin-nucleotide-binding protein
MTSSFHAGELAVQERAGVQNDASRLGKGIRSALQPAQQDFLREQRLAVASSVDAHGQVWASLLTGEPGFLQAVEERTVQINTAPTAGDPLWTNLQEKGPLGLLAINPAIQKRVRVNGTGEVRSGGELSLHVQQAFGNCPRYIQVRQPEIIIPTSQPLHETKQGSLLTKEQQDWITRADTFFVASFHQEEGADASHRGGNPGFVRVRDTNSLAWPDYNGNGMFQTLGNITTNPNVGLLFIDFEHGRTLQLTGKAQISWDTARVAEFVRAERVVEFHIDQVIEVTLNRPFHWHLIEYSPHNPA